MTAVCFSDLIKHYGHEIVISKYGIDDDAWNVAIECETCCEVLLDFDKHERPEDDSN